jgi:ATP-dependent DNA helicase PIF1
MSNYIKNTLFHLNQDQRRFVDLVLDGHNVFLTGFAGTGKSYALESLFKVLDHKNIPYGKTASTGVAAINIGGSTLHSWAGCGLGELSEELLLKGVRKNKKAKNRIKNCQLLVVDEVSMIKASLLDKLDYIFRQIRGVGTPFGGCQIVLVADFLQLPAIIRREENDGLAFESKVWGELDFKNCLLKEIIRQKDKEFSDLLSNLRVGKTDGIELLDQCLTTEFEGDIQPVKIYTKNRHVDLENKRRLDQLSTKEIKFRSIDDGLPHHIKFFDKNCPAPKELILKEGAQVMLLKNLDVKGGLFNGAVGVVEKISIAGVAVKFKFGTEILGREKWEIQEENFNNGKREAKTVACRSQIPLKLAWASTSHKIQGATLDHAHVDISDAFESGQAYVALSRVRDINNLRLEPFCPSKIMVNKKCLEFYQNLRED